MDLVSAAGIFLAAAAVCIVWFVTRERAARTVGQAKETAERLLGDARREAAAHRKEAEFAAREQARALRQENERESQKRRDELASIERQLARRTQELTEQDHEARRAKDLIDEERRQLDERRRQLDERDRALADEHRRCDDLIVEQQQALQRVAGLTADEAKEIVVKQIEQEARRDAANLVKRLEAEIYG